MADFDSGIREASPATDPILPGGEAGLREALIAFFEKQFWLPLGRASTRADALLAGPLAGLQSDRTRLRRELAAVDLAFEGLEETDRARRIGHWIGLAAAETTRANAAEAELIALARMYGEACGKLHQLGWLTAENVVIEVVEDEEQSRELLTGIEVIANARDAAESEAIALRERVARLEKLSAGALFHFFCCGDGVCTDDPCGHLMPAMADLARAISFSGDPATNAEIAAVPPSSAALAQPQPEERK